MDIDRKLERLAATMRAMGANDMGDLTEEHAGTFHALCDAMEALALDVGTIAEFDRAAARPAY